MVILPIVQNVHNSSYLRNNKNSHYFCFLGYNQIDNLFYAVRSQIWPELGCGQGLERTLPCSPAENRSRAFQCGPILILLFPPPPCPSPTQHTHFFLAMKVLKRTFYAHFIQLSSANSNMNIHKTLAVPHYRPQRFTPFFKQLNC